jgi:hypothetical protein
MAHMNDEDENGPPAPHVDAVIHELRSILKDYQAGCSFAIGDLVTPRKGRAVRGDGEPHIVLEVFDPPIRRTPDATDQLAYGRCDMRVLTLSGDAYVAHLAEGWQYERYVEEGRPDLSAGIGHATDEHGSFW